MIENVIDFMAIGSAWCGVLALLAWGLDRLAKPKANRRANKRQALEEYPRIWKRTV